ncbi:MAG: hypothetical protein ACLFSV_10825 [Alkalispirochaeta sp.]
MNRKAGDIGWLGIIGTIAALLAIPSSRNRYEVIVGTHPYLSGFVKFAILASMGELLVIRLKEGRWRRSTGFAAKGIAWGVIGVLITFMFRFYSLSVQALQEAALLPAHDIPIAGAFFTSFFMNITFGFVFMTAHRISDVLIDYRIQNGGFAPVHEMISRVDWPSFLLFIAKTVVLFWIPIHTLVFLLPPAYRILAAAALSIVLGLLLTLAGRASPRR